MPAVSVPERLGAGEARKAVCGHSRPCGCEDVAPCCLKCHLTPVCKDEYPGGLKAIRAFRARVLVLGLRRQGTPIRKIAGTLRMSHRTVYRILEEA